MREDCPDLEGNGLEPIKSRSPHRARFLLCKLVGGFPHRRAKASSAPIGERISGSRFPARRTLKTLEKSLPPAGIAGG